MNIGDKAVYYPAKKNEQDNRHPVVEVVGVTPTGRLRVAWLDAAGKHTATVSEKRLETRQGDLLEQAKETT